MTINFIIFCMYIYKKKTILENFQNFCCHLFDAVLFKKTVFGKKIGNYRSSVVDVHRSLLFLKQQL